MPDIYSRFTSEALYTMRRSREIIDEDKTRQMFPEHMLLAILELNRSDCAQVLTQLGVNLRQLKQELLDTKAEWSTVVEQHEGSAVRSYMSHAARNSVDEALLEAAHEQLFGITTRHLILGMLAKTNGEAKQLLNRHGVTLEAVREFQAKSVERSGDKPEHVVVGNPFQLSPVFLGIVAVTGIAGYACWEGWTENGIFVFLFVLGGWLISLALHEFGHALAGYYGGDTSVASKGYLTLNPLKYTHWLLSIALPMVFIVLYGIGLPGGAVYIDRSAIKDERMHSVVSAAGPIATFLFALLLAIPFIFGWVTETRFFQHPQFWSALAFLLMLEVTVLILNLLPIPGIDGYGIIEQFLPESVQATLAPFKGIGFFILFFVLFQIPMLADGFWQVVWGGVELFQVDRQLVSFGYHFFRFWSS